MVTTRRDRGIGSPQRLARQLGVSRDTVHRWIREGDLDRDLDDEAVRYVNTTYFLALLFAAWHSSPQALTSLIS